MFLLFLTLFLNTCAAQNILIPDHKLTFNQNLYKEVLDHELCHKQMQYLMNNNTNLLWTSSKATSILPMIIRHILTVLDAGIRTPRGLFGGDSADFGNYHQCLGIQHEAPSTSSTIEGKYCSIRLSLPQDLQWPSLPALPKSLDDLSWAEVKSNIFSLKEDKQRQLNQYEKIRIDQVLLEGVPINRIAPYSPIAGRTLILAVCIPKSCDTRQVLSELQINATETGFEYKDRFCRLPNDKQWVVADYIAIVIFSIHLLLLIASTSYEIYQTKILQNDAQCMNQIYKSFSVYSNTRQLVTYKPGPGTIECLDGIRAFSMLWIIAGHTYLNQLEDLLVNSFEYLNWLASPEGLWITMSNIAVDTFFLMSGLLLVYSTAGKMTRSLFMKNLHLFYFNRVMRLLPVLSAMVLIQSSILNRVSDGPNWSLMERNIENCRVNWWATLLFVQNWVRPDQMCIGPSWYLAVDMQLYLLSPLVLFWVLGSRKRVAWIALTAALILSLVGATINNFFTNLPSSSLALARLDEGMEYDTGYYINTLTRSSPFFIGMIYGYIFHLHRHERLRLSLVQVVTYWSGVIIAIGCITWVNHSIVQFEWDNQTVDNLVNSYMRPCWALAIGWIVLACHHGYGGPINWFLSLRCFKLLSRLSFAIYIVHSPLIYLVNCSSVTIGYFSPTASLFKLLADTALAVIVAYLLTVIVDSPSANLVKQFLDGIRGRRKPRQDSSK